MSGMTRSETVVQPLERGTRSVLIVMTDHHMGNLVISLPVINALAAYFENPPDVLVDARYASLAALLPAPLRVIAYPEQSAKRRGLLPNLEPVSLMLRMMRRYRAVIDIGGGARSATLSLATLSRTRLGFADRPGSWVYSRRLPRRADAHIFDVYSRVLNSIGYHGRAPQISLRAPGKAHDALDQMLTQEWQRRTAPLAVIHPGAGKEYRQWPAERFAAVADELVREYRMHVCVIGSPSERALMRAVIEPMRHRDSAFALSLPLDQLLALFERASILISNESGPTHLAAATDLPIVTIFGPSRESIWRPIRERDTVVLRGAACDPRCGKRQCFANQHCLVSLEVSRVLEAARAFLERAGPPQTPAVTEFSVPSP